MLVRETTGLFFGWRVVAAVFVLAMFGWGFGFYGPPVYLHAVREAHGWSLALVSTAVTTHFLSGAIVTATLPQLYRRFGIGAVTKAGSAALAAGTAGWALADAPWLLLLATVFSGGGWATMGGAAVNAIVALWFVRARPAALASAFNGASVGGVVFSPLWASAIGLLGFPLTAVAIGMVMVLTIWLLANLYYAKTPAQMDLAPDGDTPGVPTKTITLPWARALPGKQLWADLRFLTLAGGMSLGLFAQIGLVAHIFSLLVPALGTQLAGFALAAATVAAVVGRTLVGWLMPAGADRRLFACGSYFVQAFGSLALLAAAGDNVALLFVGVILFGAGIGNGITLPPLIAQVEFVRDDVMRVVALIVAISQATYAFAPAAFGLIREFAPQAADASPGAAPYLFIATAAIQGAAIAAFLIGRAVPK